MLVGTLFDNLLNDHVPDVICALLLMRYSLHKHKMDQRLAYQYTNPPSLRGIRGKWPPHLSSSHVPPVSSAFLVTFPGQLCDWAWVQGLEEWQWHMILF